MQRDGHLPPYKQPPRGPGPVPVVRGGADENTQHESGDQGRQQPFLFVRSDSPWDPVPSHPLGIEMACVRAGGDANMCASV